MIHFGLFVHTSTETATDPDLSAAAAGEQGQFTDPASVLQI